MGILDIVLSIFGAKAKVDFAKVNPDDLEAYWRIDHEVDQAERKGSAELATTLARWGLEDQEHWEKVKGGLFERHGKNPEFKMAAPRVLFEIALADMASSYRFPEQYISPPHGVTLDRYASIKCRMDLGQPAAAILGSYHLDDHRWREVDGTWSGRMGPTADAMAGQILRSQYQVMYQYATSAYGGS